MPAFIFLPVYWEVDVYKNVYIKVHINIFINTKKI